MQVDFEVENHGSLFLFRPITDAALAWVEDHLPQPEQDQQGQELLALGPGRVGLT